MVAFVFFSQTIVATFVYDGNLLKFEHPTVYYFVLVVVAFYGFWNVDFFRHIPHHSVLPQRFNRLHIIILSPLSDLLHLDYHKTQFS